MLLHHPYPWMLSSISLLLAGYCILLVRGGSLDDEAGTMSTNTRKQSMMHHSPVLHGLKLNGMGMEPLTLRHLKKMEQQVHEAPPSNEDDEDPSLKALWNHHNKQFSETSWLEKNRRKNFRQKGEKTLPIGSTLLVPYKNNEHIPNHHGRHLPATWMRIGAKFDGEAAGDQTGYSVSISDDGTRFAVGSPYHATGDKGGVRIFDFISGSWEIIGDLEGGEDNDTFGQSIALSADGRRLAVGSPSRSIPGVGSYVGIASVYEYVSGTTWNMVGVTLQGSGHDHRFGYSVSLSTDGSVLAVGAPRTVKGRVHVYNDSSGDSVDWIPAGGMIEGQTNGEYFGSSVALSADGNRMAVGAHIFNGNKGRMEVLEYNGTSWNRIGQVIEGLNSGDVAAFTTPISADGNRIAVGMRQNDLQGEDSGLVRIYEYNDTALWDQLGDDIYGLAANDWFGNTVSMSNDGNRVAVSAQLSSTRRTSGDRGQVRIFDYESDAWNPVGQIEAESTDSLFGYSISLSGKGDHVAVGHPSYSGKGQVRVFELTTPPPLFDFDVAVDEVTVRLTNETSFNEAITFEYDYTGAKPINNSDVSFTFDILRYDCDTEFAPAGNTSMALFFHMFQENVTDKVSAKLGIDLSKIESAPEVWSHPDDKETQAILKFCGRWNIYVEDILFQFHETAVNATINLKEDGGFDLAGVDVGLDRKDADAEDQDIEVEFPVKVFFCNDTAGEESAPTEFNQGQPIQVCLELETTKPGVYVQGIDTIEYSATEVNKTETLIDSGSLKFEATAEVDCTQVAGRCRIKWLAMAAMYVNVAGNKLVLSGLATIAFGSDPDQARRRVAFDAQSGGRRSLSDEVVDGESLAPFDFTVGNLQPFVEETSPKKEHGIMFSVLGGVALLAIVCAAAFFVRRRHPRETTVENPGKDERENTMQASSSLPSDESKSETSEIYNGYQVVHV